MGVITAPIFNGVLSMPENSVLVPYNAITSGAGATVGGVAGKIAGAARDVVCPLYRDYPSFMTGEWANNPLASYNDGFLNEFCTPPGQLPAAPTPPYTGGQCGNVSYRCTFTVSGVPGTPLTSSIDLQGAITEFAVGDAGTFPDGSPAVALFATYNVFPGAATQRSNLFGRTSPGLKLDNVSIVRLDGNPDNCGNVAPKYPIARPPDSALQVNVPIQISPNVNVTVPVSVFAPVEIFAPSLKIGDFNVDFNLGGLTISPALNINIPGTSPNGSKPIQPAPGEKPIDRNYDELLTKIFRLAQRIRECQDCDKDYDFFVTGVVGGSANSITVPIGGIPLTAAVTLVSRPSNAKVQTGRGEPDVVFAGWGWWSGNDYLSERQPIDAQTKLFYAPENPSPAKFHYTVTPGYSAQMLMSYKKLKNPVPNV